MYSCRRGRGKRAKILEGPTKADNGQMEAKHRRRMPPVGCKSRRRGLRKMCHIYLSLIINIH